MCPKTLVPLDYANQITQIDGTKGSTNTTYAQSVAYAPFGPLKTYTAGNGLNIIQQYDSDYKLTSLQSGAVINRNYQYDETGNVTQISNVGNLPETTAEALTYSYQNNNNQLTQAINGTNTTFAYNAAGNLITEQKSGTTRTFTYNYSQRLASVTEGSTTLGQYTYDAFGRRTKKVANGTTTLYIYDQNGLLIAEYDGNGIWQKDYINVNGQPLAMIVAGTTESVYYYHNDHLGTPQMMTDSTGAVVWAATYEPFGKATLTLQQTTNNLRFPGQYYDSETGLHYNWHRDYNNELGRYIQSDPIGVKGGINLFAYVRNNPLNSTDPSALSEAAYGEIGSWAVTSMRDFTPPAGLGDAVASIDAVCSPGRCRYKDGTTATAPADQAAWNNIINSTGIDRSGGGNFMCVGHQNCWFVISCYACENGQKVLRPRNASLIPSGTVTVSGKGTLYFYRVPLQGWCNRTDYISGCRCNRR